MLTPNLKSAGNEGRVGGNGGKVSPSAKQNNADDNITRFNSIIIS